MNGVRDKNEKTTTQRRNMTRNEPLARIQRVKRSVCFSKYLLWTLTEASAFRILITPRIAEISM